MNMPPVFYDFETSGFGGFPVEIGWAWFSQNGVKSDSLLIAPAENWDVVGRWNSQAEAIHGLSLGQLKREGVAPVSVADRLNHCLTGRMLYSDSLYDAKWMEELFAEAQTAPMFEVNVMPAGELLDDLRKMLRLSERLPQLSRKKLTCSSLTPITRGRMHFIGQNYGRASPKQK